MVHARNALADRQHLGREVRDTLVDTLDDAAAAIASLSAYAAAEHPTLVVGTSDFGRKTAQRLHAELPSSALAILPDSLNRSALVGTLVVDFLTSHTE